MPGGKFQILAGLKISLQRNVTSKILGDTLNKIHLRKIKVDGTEVGYF